MWSQQILLKVLLVSSFTILMLPTKCNSFHIATKLRHTHICGKKLISRIVSHCGDSATSSLSEENISGRRPLFASSNANVASKSSDNANRICCHGSACYNDDIAQRCGFW